VQPTEAVGATAAEPFELGVNYWPQRSAMYMWRDFDIGAIREELAHIAELGFDTVRIFALTADFLRRPGIVNHSCVDMLVAVARAAVDAGLGVVPTLIVLNMSGRIWWPPWMLNGSGQPVDLYTDPTALRSQALLADTCARALAGSGAVRAIDIANEIDGALRPTSGESARSWLALMADTIHDAAPGVPVRLGSHLPSLNTVNHLRIDDIATLVDEDAMHAYPLYCSTARSFLDPELVPFACALVADLSGSGRRPCMQEFGLCTAPEGEAGRTFVDDFLGQRRIQYLASEEEAALYFDIVLYNLVEAGAAGAYVWCYADYDVRLFTRPPFNTAVRERTFGLVRADGTEKPAAFVFRDFRKRRDAGEVIRGDVASVLDVSPDAYYGDPLAHFERLYARWLTDCA
jgi:endo-1,4-beta-mannosidase